MNTIRNTVRWLVGMTAAAAACVGLLAILAVALDLLTGRHGVMECLFVAMLFALVVRGLAWVAAWAWEPGLQ